MYVSVVVYGHTGLQVGILLKYTEALHHKKSVDEGGLRPFIVAFSGESLWPVVDFPRMMMVMMIRYTSE